MSKKDDSKPVLVYQMGKVGSRSVVDSLETATNRPLHHIHFLSEELIHKVTLRHREQGLDLPPHIEASRTVRETILNPGRPCDVITLVREPIARNISAFFQNLATHDLTLESSVDDMIRVFKEDYPHGQPLSWFGYEVQPQLGIDVYAQPFDPAKGWAVFERGPIRLLLLRCETPDEAKSEAIAEFLGLGGFEITRANESAVKAYRDVYKSFRDQITFEPSYLEKMYESRYMRHFYSPSEIEAFRERWSCQREPAPTSVPAGLSAGETRTNDRSWRRLWRRGK